MRKLLIVFVSSLSILLFLGLYGCSSTSSQRGDNIVSGYANSLRPISSDLDGAQFEIPPVLKASDYLPPDLKRGRQYFVNEDIYTDGFTNRYRLSSDFFVMDVQGDDMLRAHIQEVRALDALAKMKKTSAFADAVKNTAKSPFYMAKDLITHPVDTVTGVPKGIWRFMGRAGEMVTGERGEIEDTAAQELIGFSAAKRKLAHQLGVDVYSTNITLQKELNSVSWASFSGGFVTGLAMTPIQALKLTKVAHRMNKILLDNAPEDLRKMNRASLRGMGVEEKWIERFLRHAHISPRHETIIVESLKGLKGAKSRNKFIAVATTAESFEEAFFFQRVAEMLLEYHLKIASIKEIVVVNRLLMGLTEEKNLFLPLLWDYGVWSKPAALKAKEIMQSASQRFQIKNIELWTSGTLSAKARQKFEEMGFKVTEKAFSRLKDHL
ncbi:MAG: hypothetical protein JSU88_09740 [Nitrospinaceae bacterium]|nr:MAG: hypothetical protein JSU88_09740 [Nitrospinaceae bacterium]